MAMQTAVAANPVRRRSVLSWQSRQRRRLFWMFAAPWVMGTVLFTAFPLGLSLVLSFTQYYFSAPPVFAGLSNYTALFTNAIFIHSVLITLLYTAVFVPLVTAFALAIATLVNGNSALKSAVKVLVYAPTTITGVVVGWLFLWVLNPTYGILNTILGALGLGRPDWLLDPGWLMVGIIILSLWSSTGTNMVLFLAALQNVPTQLVEAARSDGARALGVLQHVTLPMLSPVTVFVVIISFIASLQIFTPVYIMTGGGPNYASDFYVLYLYQTAFQTFAFGQATAMSWLMLIAFSIITVVFFVYLSRRSYEAGSPLPEEVAL